MTSVRKPSLLPGRWVVKRVNAGPLWAGTGGRAGTSREQNRRAGARGHHATRSRPARSGGVIMCGLAGAIALGEARRRPRTVSAVWPPEGHRGPDAVDRGAIPRAARRWCTDASRSSTSRAGASRCAMIQATSSWSSTARCTTIGRNGSTRRQRRHVPHELRYGSAPPAIRALWGGVWCIGSAACSRSRVGREP